MASDADSTDYNSENRSSADQESGSGSKSSSDKERSDVARAHEDTEADATTTATTRGQEGRTNSASTEEESAEGSAEVESAEDSAQEESAEEESAEEETDDGDGGAAYEQLRLQNLERNKRVLDFLGIPVLAAGLHENPNTAGDLVEEAEAAQFPSKVDTEVAATKPSGKASAGLAQKGSQTSVRTPVPKRRRGRRSSSLCNVLRSVANLSDGEIELVFQEVARMPPISSAILQKMSATFTDIFEDSRDVSEEDRRIVRPTRRSERLQVHTPQTRSGRRRSARAAASSKNPKGKAEGEVKRKSPRTEFTSSEDDEDKESKEETEYSEEEESEEDEESEDEDEGDGHEEGCELPKSENAVKGKRGPNLAEDEEAVDVAKSKGKGQEAEPVQWKVRRRPRTTEPNLPTFKVPSEVVKVTADRVRRGKGKMLEETWTDEVEHDFTIEEPLDEVNMVPPSTPVPLPVTQPSSHSFSVYDNDDAERLQIEIAETELALLTKKMALKRKQGRVPGQEETSTAMGRTNPSRSEAQETRTERRQVEKQKHDEVVEREEQGKKRYVVDVDMRGHPYGINRPQWLKCLRGHSLHVDFSVDNYHDHSTPMLLAVKKRVDKTFEYEGGIGRLTEEAFHAILKGQLKAKRYQMKKLMTTGKTRPKHIKKEHWDSLEELIGEERKLKEAAKLKANRAQNVKLSGAGQSDSDGGHLAIDMDRTGILANTPTEAQQQREGHGKHREGSSGVSHVSKGKARADLPSPSSRDVVEREHMQARIGGMEETLKRILAHLEIPSQSRKEERAAAATARPLHGTDDDVCQGTAAQTLEQQCRQHTIVSVSGANPEVGKKRKDREPESNEIVEENQVDLTSESEEDEVLEVKEDNQEVLDKKTMEETRGRSLEVETSESPPSSKGNDEQKKKERQGEETGISDEERKKLLKASKQSSPRKGTPSESDQQAQKQDPKRKTKKTRMTELEKLGRGVDENNRPRVERAAAAKSSKSKSLKAGEDTRRLGKEKPAEDKTKSGKEKVTRFKAPKEQASKGDEGSKKQQKGGSKHTKVQTGKEDVGGPVTYAIGDAVHVLGLGDGEEDLVVAEGKVMNVAGGTLHGAPIFEDCVSVQVQKSCNDDYVLYQSVDLDYPPIEKIGQAVNSFILWPIEFLRHVPVEV